MDHFQGYVVGKENPLATVGKLSKGKKPEIKTVVPKIGSLATGW
jgi:hypothetical protein